MTISLRGGMLVWGAVLSAGLAASAALAAPPRPVSMRALARCQQVVAHEGMLYAHWLGWKLHRCLRPMGECALVGSSSEACARVAGACASVPAEAAALEGRLRMRVGVACAGVPLDQVKEKLGYTAKIGACPVDSVDAFARCIAQSLRDAEGELFDRLEPLACAKVLQTGAGSVVPAQVCTGHSCTPPPPPPPPACDGERFCGGADDVACPEGFVCDRHDALCTQGTIGGECVPAPASCPAGGSPVCGCDGTTYGSECARLQAGVTKARDGACDPPPQVCGSNTGCPAGFFCEFPLGDCGEGHPGVCKPMRAEPCNLCSAFTNGPVCGCDLVTYPDECTRAAAGVSHWFVGSCQ